MGKQAKKAKREKDARAQAVMDLLPKLTAWMDQNASADEVAAFRRDINNQLAHKPSDTNDSKIFSAMLLRLPADLLSQVAGIAKLYKSAKAGE
jgi:hypothetical protein